MRLLSKELLLLEARIELQERAWPSRAFLQFIRKYDIDQRAISRFIGGFGVTNIADCGAGRFEFANTQNGNEIVEAFVFEILDEDGESAIDLVALPTNRTSDALSMFGFCGLAGAWTAKAPGSYFMGTPLMLHRSVLAWLQSGCEGAAVVVPHIAARQLIDAPGRIAAQSQEHGRALTELLRSVVNIEDKIVVLSNFRRAA